MKTFVDQAQNRINEAEKEA